MFSITVSLPMTLVSWNVRTMPMRATLYEETPARLLPSNCHLPVFGVSKPVSRLNRVVLPAPLGPISAVILCRGISRYSTSTALMPPKLRVTFSATTIGSRFLQPGGGLAGGDRTRVRHVVDILRIPGCGLSGFFALRAHANASSFLLPRTPWGLKIISSISATPTRM